MAGWHGDDFYTEDEPGALDEVDEMILASFKAKVLPRLGPGASTEGTILRRVLRWSAEGIHMAPDAKHVENLASLLEVKGAKRSPTPSSRATGRGERDVLELLTADISAPRDDIRKARNHKARLDSLSKRGSRVERANNRNAPQGPHGDCARRRSESPVARTNNLGVTDQQGNFPSSFVGFV